MTKEDGSWSGYLSSILGWTFYHLNVTTPDGQEYTDQIGLVRFVELVMPDLTNREVLSIPGKVLKGTTLTLNGEPVAIDPADQSFVLKLPLAPGEQRFLLRAEYKEAWSQQYYTVTRIAAPEVFLSSVLLPAPSRLVGSSTFIPLRFISENLGVKVVWNGTTKSITLIVPLEQ